MSADTRQVSIRLAETLDHSAREELAVRLEHQPGIELALLDPDDSHRLKVTYHPGRFSTTTLLDFISLHGVHATVDE